MAKTFLRIKHLLIFLALTLLCWPTLAWSQPNPSPQQIETILKNLSPEQLQLLQQQLAPTGSDPTPSAVSPASAVPTDADAPTTETSSKSKGTSSTEGLRVMQGLEKARVVNRARVFKSLERFGSSFFDRSREEMIDTAELTVPDDYRLVPGDQMNVTAYNIHGGDNSSTLEVDNKGQFYVPGAGPVGVEGLTKSQVDSKLEALITSRFPNMRIRTAFVKIRKIRIFVLGEGRRPGGYLVNPNATVLDVLLNAGGPSPSGSYRRISLQRNGQTISNFDLYDLLIRGKTSSPRLQHGDRIFVPLKGPEVSIAGEIQREAIYELRGEKTLAEVLNLAGGLKPEAYSPAIKLERVDQNRSRRLLDLSYREATKTGVQAGDLIYVNPVLDDLANGVFIEGAVRRPGWYQLNLGMKVSDLVRQAEGLENGAYADQAELYRVEARSEPLQMVGFDLRKALLGDPTQDLPLRSEDRVVVYSRKAALVDTERVRIQGEVKSPGEYARFENMKVRDLITLAGGVNPEASTKAEIARPGANGQLSLIPVDIDLVMANSSSAANLPIRDLDVLIIRRELRSKRWPASITLVGEFKNPGEYAVDPDRETLADVIRRAGGTTNLAYPKAAVFTRELPEILAKNQKELAEDVFADLQEIAKQIALVENLRQNQKLGLGVGGQVNFSQLSSAAIAPPRRLNSVLSTGRIPIDLNEIIERNVGDPRVKNGDVLFLPQKPEMVIVSGAVVLPSPIVWKAKHNANNYIEQAGGFAEDAARDKVLVLRVNGSLVQAGKAGALEPGDLILVPPKALVARPRVFEQFLNVLQVVANGAFLWRVFQ